MLALLTLLPHKTTFFFAFYMKIASCSQHMIYLVTIPENKLISDYSHVYTSFRFALFNIFHLIWKSPSLNTIFTQSTVSGSKTHIEKI